MTQIISPQKPSTPTSIILASMLINFWNTWSSKSNSISKKSLKSWVIFLGYCSLYLSVWIHPLYLAKLSRKMVRNASRSINSASNPGSGNEGQTNPIDCRHEWPFSTLQRRWKPSQNGTRSKNIAYFKATQITRVEIRRL